jgi:MarR family transcriptional regulator, organic hydroperoxide resistance regulator
MSRSDSFRSAMVAVAATGTLQEQAWRHVLELFLGQRARFAAIAQELGLSPPQAIALRQLQPDRAMTMGELAQALRCDNSNVTGIVDRLEAAGLAERRPHERDRRVKTLVLTEKGVRVRTAYDERLGTVPAAIAGLSDEDAAALVGIMERALASS